MATWLSQSGGPLKKLGTLFPCTKIAVRKNGFSLRYVALTLDTKNQFLFLIICPDSVSLRISRLYCGPKNADDEENEVSKQENGNQSSGQHGNRLSRKSNISSKKKPLGNKKPAHLA